MKSFGLSAMAATAMAAQENGKCYAVAFSSGDESSAYQAGVIQGLIQHYGAAETAWTSTSGVSGGAVNAAILASFGVGDEQAAADRMVKFWEDAASSKLYKDWIGGVTEGLLLKGGLYNDAPLKSFLSDELADIGAMQREIDIGITDVLTGSYHDFTKADLSANLQDAMYASFSYAGFFPPAQSMGSDWFDGSVIWDVDIFSAVNACLETHSQADTVVDVILTSDKTLKQVDASNYHSISMLWRFLEISRYYNNMDGLLRAQFAYPNITFRSVISPSSSLPSSIYPLVSIKYNSRTNYLRSEPQLGSSRYCCLHGNLGCYERSPDRERCRRYPTLLRPQEEETRRY